MRINAHVHQHDRAAGLYWPACTCGWRSRVPRLTSIGSLKCHAHHVLAAAGYRLETLWLPEPNRYSVRWEVPLDEMRWRPDEVRFSDQAQAEWVANFLDSAPSRIRNVQLLDLGADDAAA